jgi:hypothetical protein
MDEMKQKIKQKEKKLKKKKIGKDLPGAGPVASPSHILIRYVTHRWGPREEKDEAFFFLRMDASTPASSTSLAAVVDHRRSAFDLHVDAPIP